jgi:pyruvate dehydrogenase E2 component (dihydrolipoamide acetyltransferase)
MAEAVVTEVLLPKWGLTMTEATVVRWLRSEGERVVRGDALVEVETDKADAEVPAPADGVLRRIVASAGMTVGVGDVLAELETSGAATGNAASSAAAPAVSEPSVQRARREPERGPRRVDRTLASPRARAVARELGVELDGLEGSGPGGVITEEDVRGHGAHGIAASTRSDVTSTREPLTKMRRAIGALMRESLATAPQLTLTREVSLAGLRAALADAPGDVSPTDVFVAVAARVLLRHPRLNAHVVGDELRSFEGVDIGLAVAIDGGLVVPVLRGAHVLDLVRLAAERRRLVELARSESLSQPDITGATFTVTNLARYGIDAFTPILNPPEVGILGIGAIRERFELVAGEVRAGESCVLSLTFDHRALDGAPAALFLGDVAAALEAPPRMSELLR